LSTLVAAKLAKPDQGLRLARQRLAEARRRRTADPVKFGLLTLPLLVVAGASGSWLVTIGCALLWAGIVGGVVAICVSEVRYAKALVDHITGGRARWPASGT
jgi:hypothetical protein